MSDTKEVREAKRTVSPAMQARIDRWAEFRVQEEEAIFAELKETLDLPPTP